MDDVERKALSDIEEYGCHIVHVLEEGSLPPFSYSVGIWKSSGAAELIIIGLKKNISHFAINEYNTRVRKGLHIKDGQTVGGFLEGFDCLFKQVEKVYYHEYLGWSRWLYHGNQFPTLQMVYPDTKGVWPWQIDASEWFKQRQPILASLAS